MRIVYTEFIIVTVFFTSLESTPPCSSPSASFPPASSPERERSQSPPSSYRNPPISFPYSDILGYQFEQLRLIRLIPAKNPHRRFELQKYTFSADERIKLYEGHTVFSLVPTREQIVLSTSDGDVFAILSSSNTLAGIYKYILRMKAYKRIKMNMESGRITPLTPIEVEEIPVGHSRRIECNFRVELVDRSERSSPFDEPGIPGSSRPHPSLSLTHVLGYGIQQLPFIRLCYKGNLHRLFELRKYTFRVDQPIKVLTERNHFRPIPIREQIVLTTAGSDVFAILESSNVLSGIYAYNFLHQSERRAKLNMESGRISLLTADEIKEVPVGTRREIRLYYVVDLISNAHLYQ